VAKTRDTDHHESASPAAAPCTPHQHVRRLIRVPRGARVKGKSVASRQPLVRAKNPWGAGEAESAHRGLGTRTVRETRSETETVSCRVGVPAPNPVPSAVRSYTQCVYHGQFRIGSSRSLHSRLRLKASSLELDRPSAPAGGPTCHGRRVQREASRGSSAAEGYKIVNTQRRVEAMVEAHQDAYHRTLSAHRALSATYPHTLGLTLRVYRPAHRHQTTRGARLCERPPLPPQV